MSLNPGLSPVGRKIGLPRVAELTFDVLRREFALDYALAFGLALLPLLLNVLLVRGGLQAARAGGVAHPNPFSGIFILVGLLSLVATLLTFAAISFGAVERLQGRAITLGERLNVAFRALPVLIGVAILAYIALVIATLLLVIPAFFLATCWSVVVPVVCMERLGVFGAFGRSFELTRNNRWTIFLLLLLYGLFALIVALLGGLIVGAAFGVSGGLFGMALTTGPAVWASFLLNLVVGAAMNTVAAAGVGAIYSELQGAQGGFDTRRLSEVFA